MMWTGRCRPRLVGANRAYGFGEPLAAGVDQAVTMSRWGHEGGQE